MRRWVLRKGHLHIHIKVAYQPKHTIQLWRVPELSKFKVHLGGLRSIHCADIQDVGQAASSSIQGLDCMHELPVACLQCAGQLALPCLLYLLLCQQAEPPAALDTFSVAILGLRD